MSNAMKWLASLSLVGALVACRASEDASDVKFDSAHTIALEATIPEGKILTAYSNDRIIESEIREQLMYTIGQLNGINGGPDMKRLEVSIQEKAERAEGVFEVTYAARLFVAWPRERRIPETYEFILPARGDWEGLEAFYQKYGADERTSKRCLAVEAYDVSQYIFWYYYRPAKWTCPLVNAASDDPEIVTRVVADLRVSGLNTEGKAPEYEKVWEDGRLVATLIFGKNDTGATGDFDAGVVAFRQTYQDLIAELGRPRTSNLPAGARPGIRHDDVRLTFATQAGVVDVHLYLVDSIQTVDEDFVNKYDVRTQISDFVSYSGHSGLGANIRALARMGTFVEGQYQIFLINGCDTFAYVDGALRNAHHEVNPDFGPDKFFDIITNAMPSYFHSNSRSNMAVLRGLLGRRQTYREILAGFDPAQRANVTGEEDNRWPLPFLESGDE